MTLSPHRRVKITHENTPEQYLPHDTNEESKEEGKEAQVPEFGQESSGGTQ